MPRRTSSSRPAENSPCPLPKPSRQSSPTPTARKDYPDIYQDFSVVCRISPTSSRPRPIPLPLLRIRRTTSPTPSSCQFLPASRKSHPPEVANEFAQPSRIPYTPISREIPTSRLDKVTSSQLPTSELPSPTTPSTSRIAASLRRDPVPR